MKIKTYLISFALTFALTFVINAIVVYGWNLIRHGEGAFNWEVTFYFAITFGIVLPLLDARRGKGK